MRIKNYISTISCLALLWLGMNVSSCSLVGGDSDEDVIVEEGANDIYIQLNLTTSGKAGTRAGLGDDHPYGGEDGDGTEEGHFHENDINNITIFIYNDAEGNGVNDADDTKIKFKKYFTSLDLQKQTDGSYETKPLLVHGYKSAVNDRIIVLVNMGDMTGIGNTLKSIRQALVSSAWGTSGTSIQDYYNFAMASAVDDATYGKVIITNPGTYENPFSAAVKVERLAARIDFGFAKSLEASSYRGYIEYPVEGTDDKFRLSHIRLVNASQASTYTLKRTASAVNPLTGVKYLGDETVVTSTHIPNNYVVEPNTSKKKKDASITTTELASWYGASTLEASFNTSFIAPNAYKVHSTASDSEVFEALDGTDKTYCYTIGYAMENTMDVSCLDARVITSLQIKGTYVPKNVYKWDVTANGGAGDKVAVSTYTPGTDFWYYDNQTTPANSYAFVSWDDLNAYAANHTDDYIDRYYVKGECYYYVWVRHSMYSDPDHQSGTFPMEFGIVRNNIYRIYVDKVLKIGPEAPSPELPDLIYSHVHVRDWRSRIHDEILL